MRAGASLQAVEDEEAPEVTVLAERDGRPTSVRIVWSEGAAPRVGWILREPTVTSVRLAPPARDEDDDTWDEDEDDEPAGIGDLASLDLSRVEELDVAYLRLGPAGAEALSVASFVHLDPAEEKIVMGRVRRLDLRYCRVGDAGLRAIAASSTFRDVRRLHLQSNRLTDVTALSAFERLEHLDLRYNDIGARGAAALLDMPFIGRLNRLHLYRTDVGDEGAKMLAAAPQLPPALRSLWRSV